MRTSRIHPRKRGSNVKLLTTQQQLFIKELLATKDFNITEAAKRAGYAHPSQAGTKLMANKAVANAIGKAVGDRAAKLEVTSERVVEELARIAFVNPANMFSKGKLLEISEMPEDTVRALSGFDVEVVHSGFDDENPTSTTTIKPRLWNKLEALKLLMAHLGMNLPGSKVKVEGTVNVIAQAIASVEKAPSFVVDAKAIESTLDARYLPTPAATVVETTLETPKKSPKPLASPSRKK